MILLTYLILLLIFSDEYFKNENKGINQHVLIPSWSSTLGEGVNVREVKEITWNETRDVDVYKRNYHRYDNREVLNIMEDGFFIALTFDRDYNSSYYYAQFYWKYKDLFNDENYSVWLPAIPCTEDDVSSEVLNELNKYDLGSGIICPDLSTIGTQIKMIGDFAENFNSELFIDVRLCTFPSG